MQPRYWPDDAEVYGLIFLPRFVDQIGFRVFADWTGTEVTLSEVDLLPERAEANNGDRSIASSLLREHRPDLGRQDFISSPWSAADNARRHELWRIAQQLAEREYNALPRCRLRCIRAEIRRQSCGGELTLKIRRVSGGPFEAFQPVWWNRDNPNELFDRYIIDPKYPFGGRPSWKPNTDSWIFAPREGIDQIAARLTAPPEAEPQFSRTGSVDPPKPPVVGPKAASPPPVDATTAETATSPPEPANLTDLTDIEAKPEAASTDIKQADQSQPIAPFYSGGPGRPTAVEFAVAEAKRRIEEDEVVPTQGGLSKFAEKVHLWWEAERKNKEKYGPITPKVSAKTLRNRLGPFWHSKIKR